MSVKRWTELVSKKLEPRPVSDLPNHVAKHFSAPHGQLYFYKKYDDCEVRIFLTNFATEGLAATVWVGCLPPKEAGWLMEVEQHTILLNDKKIKFPHRPRMDLDGVDHLMMLVYNAYWQGVGKRVKQN